VPRVSKNSRPPRRAALPRGAPPPAHAPLASAARPAGRGAATGAGALPVPPPPANGNVPWLVVRGARHNNLKNIMVDLPLGRFVCVTGVSGSGKSSLVNDILYKALAQRLMGATSCAPGEHDAIDGVEHLDKIIAIDQAPIGRTPRSNPGTYIKLFDEIRELFTKLPDAKLRGYKAGRFSFNVSAAAGGGRCEACQGNGSNRIEMDFLADVWVTCAVCEGRRFTRETRQVRYGEHRRPGGYSIADVLELDVQEALEVFDGQPRIRGMLQCLHDVGLDYIKIGQPSPTLSGGEAQRIKLARELVKKPTGRTLYVLDEPTTGLHFEDIRRLLDVLHGFVDAGNSVLVIEHNLDVIKTADWIVDLGPEGGDAGGFVVAQGTPEDLAACDASHTGRALRDVLRSGSAQSPPGAPSEGLRAYDHARGPDAAPASADPALHSVSVRGARQHNLKDVSVSFPRDRMTVCTGVSGSGKTSFAIDTVFTEGYRRYVESLSAYARQFLGQLQKPRVEHVEGLSPAICIEQKAATRNPRSTVGTITEIYDYLRVLWCRLGTPYCPACQTPIGTQTADEIVDRVMDLGHGTPIVILAPVRLGDGETWAGLFQRLKRSGYLRVRIDGEIVPSASAITLDARRKHRMEVVVDRTIVKRAADEFAAQSQSGVVVGGNGHGDGDGRSPPGPRDTKPEQRASSAEPPATTRRGRIAESIEHALSLGNGTVVVVVEPVERDEGLPEARARELVFSQRRVCLRCGTSFEELSPHHFSFNAPMGWCQTCEGLGIQRGAPPTEIIVDPTRSMLRGALAGWRRIERGSPLGGMLAALCRALNVSGDAGVEPVDVPLDRWTPAQRNALLFGSGGDAWVDGVEALGHSDLARVRFQWRGLFPAMDAAMRHSWSLRQRLNNVVTDVPCLTCRGGRLRPEAAAVRLNPAGPPLGAHARGPGAPADERGPTLADVGALPLAKCLEYFASLRLDGRQKKIAADLVDEVVRRLQFLVDVGLDYLTLHRAGPTLSGGEAQRIRLASQIGSGLSGVLYVLDEPTVGLHPRDTRRLITALRRLRDLGNTLLLVEHDRDVISACDRMLDFGPRAGAHGGQVVLEAAPVEAHPAESAVARGPGRAPREDARRDRGLPASLTREYLCGAAAIPIPTNRRPIPSEAALLIRGARQNNLKGVDAAIPLGRFVCVAGVSGSGKSSLVRDILWPALARALHNASLPIGEFAAIEVESSAAGVVAPRRGAPRSARAAASGPAGDPSLTESAARIRKRDLSRHVDKVVNVDQSPIGTTPLSNPATYTGVFDWIRELFARLPDSKMRGWRSNRFSFNRPGGRCEACEGQGQKRIEMHFMPDVWITCEACGGHRYTAETLEVRYGQRRGLQASAAPCAVPRGREDGYSIADVLALRVDEALLVFANVPKVRRLLQTLADVGLGYIQLGQSAPTLSGGEAQRVKLAAELGKPDTGRTLYILDEPTTGLHFEDVRRLLDVLQRLVDLGNTVVVVEHNLDVLKSADWIIDLGPEAGDAGGYVVAVGTPEEMARQAPGPSHTAAALAPVLAAGPRAERPVFDPAHYAAQQLELARIGPLEVDGGAARHRGSTADA
jgi:excinuclease ABC subunit A